MDKEKFIEIVSTSYSKNEISEKLGLPNNGRSSNYITELIVKYNLDISHFDAKRKQRKYPIIEKICPICGEIFKTKKGSPREKTVCSYSCSNTYFRSGDDNPNFKYGTRLTYRLICFTYHEHKCVCCGEKLLLVVHHLDSNRDNNHPLNLIPLCGTHHGYWHSKYRYMIKDTVIKYMEDFKSKNIDFSEFDKYYEGYTFKGSNGITVNKKFNNMSINKESFSSVHFTKSKEIHLDNIKDEHVKLKKIFKKAGFDVKKLDKLFNNIVRLVNKIKNSVSDSNNSRLINYEAVKKYNEFVDELSENIENNGRP